MTTDSALHSDHIRAWWQALGLVALTWLGIVALLFPSFASMVSVWNSSETYTHGYFVLPISMWLVWRQRQDVITLPTSADWRALIAVVGLCLLWLAANVAGAQVVEHYSLVGLALASVWALLGWSLVWALFFPLAYLLLMVPSGDSLIPHLIDFTADFTVAVLQLLQFPVYREGTFFSIPTGDWSVVEACSGIRYFLSSIVLGWLYAYITYRTLWKRLAFGIAAIIVPVFANGFRAVLIVLIGHYSGMTLAVGFDHLIYGWVWFGIVMMAMFWVGSRWREDVDAPANNLSAPTKPKPAWAIAIATLAVVAGFQLYAGHLSNRTPSPSPLTNLTIQGNWTAASKPLTTWQPRWQGMDDQRSLNLQNKDAEALIYIAWYGAQRQEAELINSQNVLVHEKDENWRRTTETGQEIQIQGAPLPMRRALLDSRQSGQKMVVWYWNRVTQENTTNPFKAKMMLAWRKLLNQNDAGAVIVVAAPYLENPAEADAVLQAVVNTQMAHINATLDKAM